MISITIHGAIAISTHYAVSQQKVTFICVGTLLILNKII